MKFSPKGDFWGKIGKILPAEWDFLQIGLDFSLSVGYNMLAQFRSGGFAACDPLAQSVEHLTFNQGVRGSNPRWITK